VLVLVATPVEVLLDTRGRMLVSGLGVGAFLVLLPALLQGYARRANAAAATELGAGLTLALVWTVAWRTWSWASIRRMSGPSGVAVDPCARGCRVFWRGSAEQCRLLPRSRRASARVSRSAGLSVGWWQRWRRCIPASSAPTRSRADRRGLSAIVAVPVLGPLFSPRPRRCASTPADLLVVTRRGSIGFVVALALALLAHSVAFRRTRRLPVPEPWPRPGTVRRRRALPFVRWTSSMPASRSACSRACAAGRRLRSAALLLC
jgi:hypothetical protein